MNRIHPHTSLLIFSVAVLMVVIAVNFYMHARVGSAVDQALLARDIVLAEEQNIVNEQDLSQLYQSTAADRARLRSLFIPSGSEVHFIEALEGIGSKTGASVNLSSITADNLDASAVGTIGATHAQVTATGSWSSVMRTLELAENLPYPVTVGNVSLGASAPGAGTHQWQVVFDIQAPIIKQ